MGVGSCNQKQLSDLLKLSVCHLAPIHTIKWEQFSTSVTKLLKKKETLRKNKEGKKNAVKGAVANDSSLAGVGCEKLLWKILATAPLTQGERVLVKVGGGRQHRAEGTSRSRHRELRSTGTAVSNACSRRPRAFKAL